MRDVYVIGAGVVSAAGSDLGSHIDSFRRRKSGLGKVSLFRTALDVPAGEVSMSNSELRRELSLPGKPVISRTALLGMKAASQAFEDACSSGFRLKGTIGLICGTSVGGMDISEDFWETHRDDLGEGDISSISMHDCGASTQAIASYLKSIAGCPGFDFITTISTACSSAGNAIMLGARMIRSGQLDYAIVGGMDSLCRFTLNGFNSLMILDSKPCRPFDATEAGLNLGEGAGFLILASDVSCRQAYCRVTGWSNVDEAFHQTGSSPEGDGPYMAMSQALAVAGLKPSEISFVNTHGTGTPSNDLSESSALIRLFQDHVPPFNSLKAYFGHTLGASEGVEAVCCAAAVKYGIKIGSLNFSRPIPGTGLVPYTGFEEGAGIDNIISNSFGFGGNCSSLVFSKL
ncbi:MAG: beta-ketoacyl-[acyl-carrier-protein] synthase family protein [Bacteroidales bacterium]|jgi:3-oxoacyl-[acyl-carrier-protein] synthase-1|nr:beta-ketoacyl-[acyl-carrier-protein] synthase family protein [Bacteroidales bacterium]